MNGIQVVFIGVLEQSCMSPIVWGPIDDIEAGMCSCDF